MILRIMRYLPTRLYRREHVSGSQVSRAPAQQDRSLPQTSQ
jgi:hypothetical protein